MKSIILQDKDTAHGGRSCVPFQRIKGGMEGGSCVPDAGVNMTINNGKNEQWKKCRKMKYFSGNNP